MGHGRGERWSKSKRGKGGYGVSDVQLSSGSGCLVKVGGERRGAGEGGDHGRGTKRKWGDEGEEMVVCDVVFGDETRHGVVCLAA